MLKQGLSVVIASILSSATYAGSATAATTTDTQLNNAWYKNGQATITEKLQQSRSTRAKNVILFVGDGMGISTQASMCVYKKKPAQTPHQNSISGFILVHTASLSEAA